MLGRDLPTTGFSDNKLQFWFERLRILNKRSKNNSITAGSAPICSSSRLDSCPVSLSNGSKGKLSKRSVLVLLPINKIFFSSKTTFNIRLFAVKKEE
jgi:hypothetical protein